MKYFAVAIASVSLICLSTAVSNASGLMTPKECRAEGGKVNKAVGDPAVLAANNWIWCTNTKKDRACVKKRGKHWAYDFNKRKCEDLSYLESLEDW